MSKIQQSLINELAPTDTMSFELFVDRVLSYNHIEKSIANAALQVIMRVMREENETYIGPKTAMRIYDNEALTVKMFSNEDCERIYDHYAEDVEIVVTEKIDETSRTIGELTRLDEYASIQAKKAEIAITEAIRTTYHDYLDDCMYI